VIAFVWQFDIKPGREPEFEHFFGPDGPWHALGRRSRSFLGSAFLRDITQTPRYLLVEYWSEMLVYEKHQADFRDELQRLEEERDVLVEQIVPVGIFNAISVPDRAGPTWTRRTGH
jgi:hypothetical protein